MFWFLCSFKEYGGGIKRDRIVIPVDWSLTQRNWSFCYVPGRVSEKVLMLTSS